MIAAWLASPEHELGRLLFASLRTGAALALLPGIGGALLPLRVRIGLAAAIGLLVIEINVLRLPEGGAVLGAVAGELLIGAAVGVLLQGIFAVASVAGELLSQAMGLGFATIVQPGGMTSPVLTSFLSLTMWLVFLGLRDLAAERKVPVLRYPQLTRAIFFTGRVGQPIRDDLYGPVAAILAFVFSLDAEAARDQPEVEVPAKARFDEFGRAGG